MSSAAADVRESPYVPNPTSRQDWLQYKRDIADPLSGHPHPRAPLPRLRTSLDHLALIDEALSLDCFHKRSPQHTESLSVLGEALNTPAREQRFQRIRDCHNGLVAFTTKPMFVDNCLSDRNGGAVSPTHCHCRACPTCQAARRRKLRALFTTRYKAMHRPKLLTLTLAHKDEPLRDQCHRLKEAFRRLRARALWKQCVAGGWWVIEIKRSAADNLWHVHAHAVIDAQYIPHDWIKQQWRRITGDSCVVDIRRGTQRRAKYIAKYVAKGTELTGESEALWSYYEAFHRARDTNTFGECKDAPAPKTDLTYLGIVGNILARAALGDDAALWALPEVERLLCTAIRERESHSP